MTTFISLPTVDAFNVYQSLRVRYRVRARCARRRMMRAPSTYSPQLNEVIVTATTAIITRFIINKSYRTLTNYLY